MNIGEAAAASGVSAKMIRHYESIGLIPAPARTGAGYRTYQPQDVQRLIFIHHARELGFSIPQIGTLLALWSNQHRASQDVKALASQHLVELDRKIEQLQAMKMTLEQLICACQGNQQSECPIMDHLLAGKES